MALSVTSDSCDLIYPGEISISYLSYKNYLYHPGTREIYSNVTGRGLITILIVYWTSKAIWLLGVPPGVSIRGYHYVRMDSEEKSSCYS